MLDLIELGDFDLTYTWDLCSSSKELNEFWVFFTMLSTVGAGLPKA
jgi:hypothetical protein